MRCEPRTLSYTIAYEERDDWAVKRRPATRMLVVHRPGTAGGRLQAVRSAHPYEGQYTTARPRWTRRGRGGRRSRPGLVFLVGEYLGRTCVATSECWDCRRTLPLGRWSCSPAHRLCSRNGPRAACGSFPSFVAELVPRPAELKLPPWTRRVLLPRSAKSGGSTARAFPAPATHMNRMAVPNPHSHEV
jgi:hypothetical protein